MRHKIRYRIPWAGMSQTSRIIAREVLATVAWGLLLPFGLTRSKRRTPRQKEQRTIVFVHGYVSNRASFLPLSLYLRGLGAKPILSFNYSSTLGVEQAAIELKDFLKARVRGGRIDLICHSLGGVIARVYVQDLGGVRRVDRCITLGTPHKGTYNSYWVASRIGRELRPDSDLIKRLFAEREKSGTVRYTSIVGESDNIIIPRESAVSSSDTVSIPEVGHVGLLFSPTAFQAIARRLLAD
ncbi:MAG: hypothetical protein HYR96_01820 [Deltaproteobacteria bacterium]|nr:hypothetical protein [Deltaproteobacteria bacterium]MBI3295804.1 hypothetical protein [Deltaproteobacteria bacterium]